MIDLSDIRRTATQLTRAAAAILLATSLFSGTTAQSQGLPPLAKNLKPSETALILVDFQYPFTNPAGGNYRAVKNELEGKQMLDRTVDLVKKARGMGVWVVHVTEGYSGDYREVDATNPGGFHRGQILRQAWKTGAPETAYYPPLVPGPGDKARNKEHRRCRIHNRRLRLCDGHQRIRSRLPRLCVEGFHGRLLSRPVGAHAEEHLSDVVEGSQQRRIRCHAHDRLRDALVV